MKRTLIHSMLALAVLATMASGEATAAAHRPTGIALDAQIEAQRADDPAILVAVSASSAAQIAQGRYGGEVLRVSRSGDKFRVKLRTSSGVIVVCVSASSGQIVGC
jgi:hypothetical protein